MKEAEEAALKQREAELEAAKVLASTQRQQELTRHVAGEQRRRAGVITDASKLRLDELTQRSELAKEVDSRWQSHISVVTPGLDLADEEALGCLEGDGKPDLVLVSAIGDAPGDHNLKPAFLAALCKAFERNAKALGVVICDAAELAGVLTALQTEEYGCGVPCQVGASLGSLTLGGSKEALWHGHTQGGANGLVHHYILAVFSSTERESEAIQNWPAHLAQQAEVDLIGDAREVFLGEPKATEAFGTCFPFMTVAPYRIEFEMSAWCTRSMHMGDEIPLSMAVGAFVQLRKPFFNSSNIPVHVWCFEKQGLRTLELCEAAYLLDYKPVCFVSVEQRAVVEPHAKALAFFFDADVKLLFKQPMQPSFTRYRLLCLMAKAVADNATNGLNAADFLFTHCRSAPLYKTDEESEFSPASEKQLRSLEKDYTRARDGVDRQSILPLTETDEPHADDFVRGVDHFSNLVDGENGLFVEPMARYAQTDGDQLDQVPFFCLRLFFCCLRRLV